MVFRECMFFFALALTTYDALQNATPKVSDVPRPTPLFPRGSLVTEWYGGELSTALPLIFSHEVSFVMYYAPWDAECQHALREFDAAARLMHGRVHFAAINCWQPGGECRSHHVHISVWPIMIVHTNLWKTLVYNGPKDYMSMVAFLNQVIKPMKYLTSVYSLSELEASCDAVALGFIPLENDSTTFDMFYNVALKRIEFDPFGDICFGVVTSESLAYDMGVDHVPHVKLVLWNETLEYPINMPFREENVSNWILTNVHRRVQWVIPSWRKSVKLQGLFNKHPVLVMFTPRNLFNEHTPSYDLLREVALEYNNCIGDTKIKKIASILKSKRQKYIDHEKHKKAICKEFNILYEKSTAKMQPHAFKSKIPKNAWFNKTCKKDIFNKEFSFSSISKDSYLHIGTGGFNEEKIHYCYKDTDCTDNIQQSSSIFESHNVMDQAVNGVKGFFDSKQFETSQLDILEDPRSSLNLLKKHLKQFCMHVDLSGTEESQAVPIQDDNNILNIEGLRCQTNDSLYFIAIDSILNPQFAESLGIDISKIPNKTSLIILDNKRESQYLLQKPLGESSIREFIHNFTQNILPRNFRTPVKNSNYTHYYGSDPEFKNVLSTQNNASSSIIDTHKLCRVVGKERKYVCIKILNSKTFESFINQKNKAILVIFCNQGVGACGGVLTVTLLRLVYSFTEINEYFEVGRIDGSLNDLSWEYTVSKYPTIMFFPSERKENSRIYPDNKPITIEGLYGFVLTGFDVPLRLHAQVLLCNSTMDDYGMKMCLSSIRQSVANLIGKHLRYWRRSSDPSIKNILLRRLQCLRTVAISLGALHSTKVPPDYTVYKSFCESINRLSNIWKTTFISLSKRHMQSIGYDYL